MGAGTKIHVAKRTVVFIMMIMTFISKGLSQQMPQKVQDAFDKEHPNIDIVSWSKEPNTIWEAEFDLNKIEYSSEFLEDGTWIGTEHEIKIKDAPEIILQKLKNKFSNFKIEEIQISKSPNGTFFEVELKKRKTEIELLFDENGNYPIGERAFEEDENDN